METNPVKIGARIKSIRKNLGLTQTEFAKKINATLPAVSNWETGRNVPNNERLKAIAKIGDMTVDELLYGSLKEFVLSELDRFYKEKREIDEQTISSLKEIGEEGFSVYHLLKNKSVKKALEKSVSELITMLEEKIIEREDVYRIINEHFFEEIKRGNRDYNSILMYWTIKVGSFLNDFEEFLNDELLQESAKNDKHTFNLIEKLGNLFIELSDDVRELKIEYLKNISSDIDEKRLEQMRHFPEIYIIKETLEAIRPEQ